MDSDPIQDLATRVLVLYDDDCGKPEWLGLVTNALGRFGLQLGTRPLSAVSSVQNLLEGHRFCVFVLVADTGQGTALRQRWHQAFQQFAASTQLLRVVDEHEIGDVIADAVLSDVERIASRLRRQRASTVAPSDDALAPAYDYDE